MLSLESTLSIIYFHNVLFDDVSSFGNQATPNVSPDRRIVNSLMGSGLPVDLPVVGPHHFMYCINGLFGRL